MAGLGFKDFAVGEVLTAADVDGYLMQQSVMRFADAGARGSALGTAVGTAVALSEGMIAYLDDVNEVQVFDGATWRTTATVLQVVSVTKTDTFSASVATGASTDITDLSITHTATSASNKVLLMANIGLASNSDDLMQLGIAFADGGTLIGIGDTSSNRTRVGSGALEAAGTSRQGLNLMFVYSPGDTASHTYTVRIINSTTSTKTLYVNRSATATDNANLAVAASTFMLVEVQA